MNVVELALKATVALAAAALSTTLLRRHPAALRHLIWTAAVLALLMLPFATRSLPPLEVQALAPVMTVVDVYASAATPAPGVDWGRVLRGVWLAGAAALLLRLGLGFTRLAWLTRRCRPLVRRGRVRILSGSTVAVPVTWGVFRPVILLPAAAADWPPSKLDGGVGARAVPHPALRLGNATVCARRVRSVLVPSAGLVCSRRAAPRT